MKALISVFYKDGIVDFARRLNKLGVDIVSTGGTYKILKQNDIPVTEVSELTGFQECLEGRVKTLHPVIHAGILAKRSSVEHMEHLKQLNIDTIDFVVVNLYPFKDVILKEDTTFDLAVENIDIGGPTMLRAAAKNYQDVAVIVDPEDYGKVLEEYEQYKNVSIETKLYLMQKVFAHTAAYDALIAKYLANKRGDYSFPKNLTLVYEKVQDMRYGENPHQKASFYKEVLDNRGNLTGAVQLNGKELSFNNINDTNGALELLKEFDEPTVVACKHGNPCGVGSAKNIYEAWSKAYNADKVSIFGGIVVLNQEVSLEIAKEMKEVFLEVIVA
ncbi:MAG: bifunctional phosphoribosylaminoimidazolecarboxamide formyltransferase/IMP cyclohydrolase, partial [Bacilli bacterium]|nr:bifunctional phosphoribosylaminoimidazolecarboxamide formyltransferase/IMP cyclohydrolase [Bacilli bacterium]